MATVYYEDYIADDTEKYDESQDEDFHPDDAPAADEPSSSSEEDDAPLKTTSRSSKRKVPVDAELDSGDEATINAARKKKQKKPKKGKKGHDDDDDDEEEEDVLSDNEGGLIRTRAQRRIEHVEKRPLARTDDATIDVDAVWAQMLAAPLKPVQHLPEPIQPSTTDAPSPAPKSVPAEEEEQIQIKKTYTFAGQDTTEEKSIPRSQLDKYTSDGWVTVESSKPIDTAAKQKANTSALRRPLRRPSRFDANPTGYVRALAPEHQLTYPRATTTTTSTPAPPPEQQTPAPAKAKSTQKLNVVDKSRMDWTGFVDKEGIAEELDTHGKTKEAYLGRMEFLKEVEARREEEMKRARVAGMSGGAGGAA
ncbi:swr complex subunit [Pleosporales sp. CAS-2024a]